MSRTQNELDTFRDFRSNALSNHVNFHHYVAYATTDVSCDTVVSVLHLETMTITAMYGCHSDVFPAVRQDLAHNLIGRCIVSCDKPYHPRQPSFFSLETIVAIQQYGNCDYFLLCFLLSDDHAKKLKIV